MGEEAPECKGWPARGLKIEAFASRLQGDKDDLALHSAAREGPVGRGQLPRHENNSHVGRSLEDFFSTSDCLDSSSSSCGAGSTDQGMESRPPDL